MLPPTRKSRRALAHLESNLAKLDVRLEQVVARSGSPGGGGSEGRALRPNPSMWILVGIAAMVLGALAGRFSKSGRSEFRREDRR